jgi:hypothetical protein
MNSVRAVCALIRSLLDYARRVHTSGASRESGRSDTFFRSRHNQTLRTPNKTHVIRGYEGWAYCARTPDKNIFLVYFEKGCPRSQIRAARPLSEYRAQWFDPRKGTWLNASATVESSSTGIIELPGLSWRPGLGPAAGVRGRRKKARTLKGVQDRLCDRSGCRRVFVTEPRPEGAVVGIFSQTVDYAIQISVALPLHSKSWL